MRKTSVSKKKIRYAVVGLGHIAQHAVLPSFQHAKANSELVALVSGEELKLKSLSKKYKVAHTFSYDEYDNCLKSGLIDAVYLALPNDMHRDYAIRAARQGIHILCEKPLAVTGKDARAMLSAAREMKVQLMTAYRLHFERANLEAIHIARSGKLGELRSFTSTFAQQVSPGNVRTRREDGGGPLYDMGVYCINASRYLFRESPLEVSAVSSPGPDRKDPRFKDIDEMTSAILTYPDGKIAQFISSFGSASVGWYEVSGTRGSMFVDGGYGYEDEIRIEVKTSNGKTMKKSFKKRDQFASELLYFSECVRKNREPEPSALEGLIDTEILEATAKSARIGRPVMMNLENKATHPDLRMNIYRHPLKRKPKLVDVQPPSRS